MTDVDKIVRLLATDAVEKRIAAAIVLGEISAKGAHVVDALTGTLDSGIALLQRHALEALARTGAKRAAPKIVPLLAAREDDVRRAAVAALVRIGPEVLPTLRARMSAASPDERRSIDAVLAALGGKDAFHTLLEGMAASNAEAAKAAAIAVRQKVKDADARQRKSYLLETERFLEKQANNGGNAGAIAAGVKILGYLEDEKAIPLLVGFASGKGAAAVRQEALIALRFVLGKRTADAKKVVQALVEAAEDSDRSLAQTALHTLAGLTLSADAMKRLERLAAHPDLERARFVLEMLGRAPGAEPARVLVGVLAATKDKRRAELAAACLLEHGDDAALPSPSPGSGPVRGDAVAPLVKALLDAQDVDRAWLLRNVLRPSAKRVPAALRKTLLDAAIQRLSAGDRGGEALLAGARDGDAAGAAEALRALAQRMRRNAPEKAIAILRLLSRSEGCSDEDRYALAAAELTRGVHDTRPAARAGDEALRLLGALLDRGVDVGAQLRKDRSLELDHLYYVGFHFTETGHPVGEELLRIVADKGGRTKIGKMARSKLSLNQDSLTSSDSD
jgi:HEAT repeats